MRAEQFWSHVEKSDECWMWTGYRHKNGYGRVNVWGITHSRATWAHRVAWQLVHGPIPEGMCILHRCDNPPCVNPDHLFLGTQADNVRDRDEKGRTYRKYPVGYVKPKVSRRKPRVGGFCVRGHQLTPTNLYLWHPGQRDARMACKECRREDKRKHQDKQKRPRANAA